MPRPRSSSSAPQTRSFGRTSRKNNKPPLVSLNRISKKKRSVYARQISYEQKKYGLSPISEGNESQSTPSPKRSSAKTQKNRIDEGTIIIQRQPILNKSIISSNKNTLRSLWKGIKNKLGLRKSKSAR